MRAPGRFPAARLAPALLALIATAAGADNGIFGASSIYRLTGDPLAGQSLGFGRWPSLRLETAAGLGAHELRVLTAGNAIYAPGARTEGLLGLGLEPMRATYRYTLLERPNWDMKLGLSANLREASGLRPPLREADHPYFGTLPLVHLAGEGRWSPRWRLAFALDGLMTGRGRAVDLGVQVNYLWTPSLSVFGGYQLTEAAGDAESFYGAGLNNRANIGVRLRF